MDSNELEQKVIELEARFIESLQMVEQKIETLVAAICNSSVGQEVEDEVKKLVGAVRAYFKPHTQDDGTILK